MKEYLKKYLATNIPQILILRKRYDPKPELEFTTKEPTGKNEHPYLFVTPEGRELMHYAKEYEEENLKLFKEGEHVQIVRQEKVKADGKSFKIMVWTPEDGAEAISAATPQPLTGTATAKQEKRFEDQDKQRKAKDMQICLQGFMQAHIISGKTNQEAMSLAEEARALLIFRVLQMLDE